MTTKDEALGIVAAFHEHLNAREPEKLLDLAADDIKIGGPRGSGTGKDLLYEWVGRANVTMTPLRTLVRDGVVVVEQRGEWKSAETGEITGSQTLASVFRIADGKIVGLARYGAFGEAANKAGLDKEDEVRTK
jgi:hypothetical protein